MGATGNEDLMSNNRLHLPPLNIRRTILGTVAIVALILAAWLLYRFRLVVLLLFIAIFLSTAMKPAVSWLHERGLPRPAGIGLVYSLLLALLVMFAIVGAPLIAEQSARIAGAIPEAYSRLRVEMLQRPNLVILRLGIELPERLPLLSEAPQNQAEAAAVLGETWRYLLLSTRVLFGVILTFIMAFYWTLHGERIKRGAILLLPQERRELGRDLIAEVEDKLARYTNGLLLLVAAVGVMSFVAYMVIGLPYALLLAVIAGLLEAVPVVGPALGAIPAALVGFSLSPWHALWVIVATLIIQQIENNLLMPRVMNRAIGVHAVVTLLAFIAFGILFGLVGALVAIPLVAVVQVIFNRFVLDPEAGVVHEPEGRDRLSVLRYETQELVGDVRKRVREAEATETEQIALEDTLEAIAMELEQVLAEVKDEDGGTEA
jgi:predicted PurR-regulated permease PerM